MWYQFIKDTVLGIRWLRKRKSESKRKMLKERILRYFEDGQRNVHSSFYQTKDSLLRSNLLRAEEFDIATEVLKELVSEGFLEYQGGDYFLKGHAPKF